MSHPRIYNVSYSIDLLDQSLAKIGTLQPIGGDQAPVITNNVHRTIKRSLEGLQLLPSDFAAVNPLTDRLKVWGTINGVTKPLGVFMFTDPTLSRFSYGVKALISMVDLNGLLDQPMGRPVGYDEGTNVTSALTTLANEVGIVNIDLAENALSSPASFPSSTSRASVMAQLANAAGLYSPFFGNDGYLRTLAPPELTVGELAYHEGHNIIAGTLQEFTDLLTAPNRWVVESVGANDAPIWSAYDIPAEQPHSYANRGFYITTIVQGQGIASTDDAYNMARTLAQSENETYEWAEFDSIPSHDHDTFEVVGYLNTAYREQEWSLPLKASAVMHHSLRRHYL
jgi:hypothetical protein